MKRIFSLILVLMAMQMAFAAKVVVRNTSDDAAKEGSLRWACEKATAKDTIVFDFGTSGDKLIKISSKLYTTASIDGSTWKDSIIIEGAPNFDGLELGGSYFIKNITVQNCYNGFWVSTGSKLLNCIARNCYQYGFFTEGSGISYTKCKSLNNKTNGFHSLTGSVVLDDCDAIGNLNSGAYGPNTVKNSRFYYNKVGINTGNGGSDEISGCVISGNDSIGLVINQYSYKVSDNIIGLSADQKNVVPNGVGVYTTATIDSIVNNVISGNRKEGFVDYSMAGFHVFKGNCVGTNRFFDDNTELGNGGDGLIPWNGNHGSIKDFSDNIFVNNDGYGINLVNYSIIDKTKVDINGNGSVVLNKCYFGITPDGKSMPNGLGGLNWKVPNLTLNDCNVCYNNGPGVSYLKGFSSGKLEIYGGKISYNKENGIDYNGSGSLYLNVKDVVFDSNGKSPISFFNKVNGLGAYNATFLSENKFLNTAKGHEAFETNASYPVPEFTSCKITDKSIDFVGKIDSTISAKIELFYTSQGEQTAELFLTSFETEEDGSFKYSLDKSKLEGKSILGFTATATYSNTKTSQLSKVVYPEFPKVDLTRANFYVKQNGSGDGSSWSKAMNPQSFAYYLPQAKDGSTFHVAEGTYYPMYDENMNTVTGSNARYTINSDITIKGGYSPNPKEGDVSDPSKYKATFSGDFMEDDDIKVEGYDEKTQIDSIVNYLNYEDDCKMLFYVQKSKPLSFDGVIFRGSCEAVDYVDPNAHISIDHCNFMLNSSNSIYCEKNNTVLKIYNSSFEKCSNLELIDTDTIIIYGTKFKQCGIGPGINALYVKRSEKNTEKGYVLLDSIEFVHNYSEIEIAGMYDNVHIRKSIFDDNVDNMYLLQFLSNINTLLIEDCIFDGNNGYNYLGKSAKGGVRNCLFMNNQNNYYVLNLPSKCSIENCSFVENQSHFLIQSDMNALISNCNFMSNKCNSLVNAFHLTFENNIVKKNIIEADALHSSGDVNIVGSQFIGNSLEDPFGNLVESIFIDIDNSLIEDNTTTADMLYSSNGIIKVNHCSLLDNKVSGHLIYSEDSVSVFNSTFAKNLCRSIACGATKTSKMTQFTFNNNTVFDNVNNMSGTYLFELNSSIYPVFQNNTIISNEDWGVSFNSLSSKCKFIGNIVSNPSEKIREGLPYCYIYANDLSDVKYNIIPQTGGPNNMRLLDETNIVLSDINIQNSIFSNIFDGETRRGTFSPLLKDNSGYTPTVALKKDRLSDGRYIRFPRIKDIPEDQRGEARLDMTCMGAYEMGCSEDIVKANDTILAGSKKFGVTYDKIGVYTGITHTFKSSIGCDSVVDYTIYVLPNPEIKEFYVKTNGKGDGSDWDHALSQADFDYILKTLSTDDVTFYLAGGTYHARYDRDFNYFENSSKNCTWTTYRPVTIIGGFDPESKGKVTSSVVPDVKKFPTVLSGDVDENDELEEDGCSYTINNQSDNVRTHLFTIDLSENPGTINLSNLVFSGTHNTTGYAYGVSISSTQDTKDKINANVSQCEFSKCYFGLNGNQVSNLTVDGCEFNYIKDLGLATSDYCKVTNSTFKYCFRGIVSYTAKSSSVVNCTFVNNTMDFDSNAEITEFYNNTFVSCSESRFSSLIYSDKSNYLYGNIFAGSRLSLNNNGSDGGKLDIANNVIAADFGTITLGKGNIKVDPNTLFDGILDVVYSQKNGIEGINLSTKNGSTPVVALLKDELPTGEKIRFDRLDGVTKDQCGVERLDSTCMGACELGCTPITTFATDTIEIGTKFKDGKVYNEFGRHDNVLVTEIVDDCENTTNYTLYVMPKLTSDLNYYVKMEKKGKGDGSDWDNPMDGKDFASCLPLAPKGATFHVAAGEYKPEYDNNLEETKYYSSRQYTINKDVTIIGGYPSGATGKDVPSNPKMYITTFNGLFKSDNKEYTVSNLFNINILEDLTLTIDGAVLKNAYSAVRAYNDLRVPNAAFDANFMNVSFENNSSYAIYSSADKGSIKLDHSSFKNNSSCIYSLHSNVDVRNSSFEKNGSDYLITIMKDSDTEGNKCGLNIDSSSFVGNTGYIQVSNDLFIKNSVFDSNETSGNFISAWSSSKFPDYSIGFSNNSFVNNKFGSDILESYSNTLATIENCQFTDNECGHDMIKTNYLTVYKSNLLRNNVKDVMFNCNYKTSFVSDTIADCTASDIVKYSVYGSHIDSCLIKNNDAYLLSYVQNTEGVRVKYDLNNSEIIGNTKTGNIDPTKYIINIHCGQSKNDSVNIIKSIFKNNKYNDCVFIFNYGSYFTFDQCLVESNEVRDFIHSDWAQSDISNSTFVDNDVDLLLYCNLNGGSYSKGTGATYKNNTIVRNNCNSLFDGYHSTSTYKNNTIVGNTCENYLFRHFHSPSLVGNILFGNVYGEMSLGSILIDDNFVSNIMPSHKVNDGIIVDGYSEYHLSLLKGNILSDQYYKELSEDESLINDVDPKEINHLSDVASLFEGTYNSKTGLFTPVLEDNGGFTPTVALKNDHLPDGTSIRFPRLEDVLTDQRGIDRSDPTCMGAYEIPKIDTVIIRDTIEIGNSFVFNDKNITPEKIGFVYDTMLINNNNVETVQVLKLCVRPKTGYNYYVKTKAEGLGDGSSWENAMSAEDFAFSLPFCAVGARYYVAKGTYKPIYDAYGNETDDNTEKCFRVTRNVFINGGYPADAETGATADPDKFPTIFSGDFEDDDEVVKGVDDYGRLKITYKNREDNSNTLFRGDASIFAINGSIVEGATSYGVSNTRDERHFISNYSTFRNCGTAVNLPSKDAVLEINNTRFENNTGCLYTPSGWNTMVESSTFTGNTGYLVYSAGNGGVKFDTVVVSGNNAQIYCVNNVQLKVSNSEFTDNDNSSSLAFIVNADRKCSIRKSVFNENKCVVLNLNSSTSLDIDSCKFIGNTNEVITAVGGSQLNIEHAVFENNIISVSENDKSDGGSIRSVIVSYGDVAVNSSSFFNNKCGKVLYVNSLDATNNTFVGNEVSSIIYKFNSGNRYRLLNNTIISNRATERPLHSNSSAYAYLYGNIILDNIDVKDEYKHYTQYASGKISEFYNIQEVQFNLMDLVRKSPQTESTDMSTYVPDDNTNILVKPYEIENLQSYNCKVCELTSDKAPEYYLTNLFEGTIDSNTGRFIPVIKDNGGFTPTVALKSNMLPDGTEVIFPRLEDVLTDQRGIERFDMTCMGSYETRCGVDTTFVNDTIVVGTEYKDGNIYEVGRHDSIIKVYTNRYDCDSIVCYTLYVMPDPSVLNYYVKTERVGKGDGSDWDNAMDGKDFASCLPLAPKGATFYVAEGTYKPIYGVNLSTPTSTSKLCYELVSDVTIKGGYRADAEKGDAPNPSEYHTIFDGDIKGNDVVEISTNDDGKINIFNDYIDDNASDLFYISSINSNILFDGVVISNSINSISAFSSNESNLTFESVTFDRNKGFAILSYAKKGDIRIAHSSFKHNIGCVYSEQSNINITSSYFEENGDNFWVVLMNHVDSEDKMCSVVIDSTKFISNAGTLQTNTQTFISNCIFESNFQSSYDNVISFWRSFGSKEYDVVISNSTFEKNVSHNDIIESYADNTIINNCRFIENVSGSDLISESYNGNLEVKQSLIKDNQLNVSLFNTKELKLLSDTIESCKSRFMSYPLSDGFSIDSCLIKNNDLYLIDCKTTNEVNGRKFELLNSEVVGNKKTDSDLAIPIFNINGGANYCNVNVYRSIFKDNTYDNNYFFYGVFSIFNIEECYVNSNKFNAFYYTQQSQSDILRSTFVNNSGACLFDCRTNGGTISKGTGVTLKNNTIVDNIITRSLYKGYYSKSTILNNTFVGNINEEYLFYDLGNNSSIIGNLIYGNVNKLGQVEPYGSAVTASYNVMELDTLLEKDLILDNTNIISDHSYENKVRAFQKIDFSSFKNYESDLISCLEGSFDSKTGLFTPVLKDNGGFTPTVALKNDHLSDGTSIRFPRLKEVLTDQRGEVRFDSTCMGAYELRCSPVITKISDTILVGEPYSLNDKDLTELTQKMGIYHVSDTLVSSEDCDSIVLLTLAVRPEKREGGYYVKVKGTGDGSDWNNAMSPSDFSTYLALAYDEDTFRIAEGVYKSDLVDPDFGRVYFVNSTVALIGGYPDSATSMSTSPMPDLFTTKLTADVKSNDYAYYYPNSLDITPYSKFNDNDSLLIYVNGNHKLSLFGLTLSGVNSCERGVVELNNSSSLVVDRCSIRDNVASAIHGNGSDVTVTNSIFTHNYSNNGTAFNLVDSKLDVKSSAIYENVAMNVDCGVDYSKGGVANFINTEAKFENSTLASNAADMGSVFCITSTVLDLTNNTIVGNQIIPTSTHNGSVFASLDDNTTSEVSSISLFGNLIISNNKSEVDGDISVKSSDYNVFSSKLNFVQGSHDMIMNDPKEVQLLLDGEMAYGSETQFIPNVQNNGGYTPTVAVIQSIFDGGQILNIPEEARRIQEDQRGFVRKDSSCIGAFEFPTYTGYYVKQNPQGDGSGRDWENCMGDTAFAKYFSIVPTNASFHIAEGVYSPMFDSYGKLTNSKDRKYSASRLLNIYGGYPDSAQTGCVADPIRFKTVLSVDYNNDDKCLVSSDSYSYLDRQNTSDNGYSIVSIFSKVPGTAVIKGVEFRGQVSIPRGSSSAVQLASSNISGVNYIVEQCSFIDNYSGLSTSCDSLIVRECNFDSISAYALSHSSFSTSKDNLLLVDKSTFMNSLYSLSAYSFKGLMRTQNSTFTNALYSITTPGGFSVTPENTKVELYNNSIFSGTKDVYGINIYNFVPVELKGNVISANNVNVSPDPNHEYESLEVVSDFNVYTTEVDAYPLGKNDTIVPQSSIADIYDGVVTDEIFEASIEDMDVYVKTPVLKNVKFNDGGGVKKISTGSTPVDDDQLGLIRPTNDYCIGSVEADCEFKDANFKLKLVNEVICRDDTAKVLLTGLTTKEMKTYKFAWTSSKDSVYVVDTFNNPGSFHVYARQALVPLQMTITNACGHDTVLEIMQNVNGVGSVPFDGIEEGDVFCQAESEPVLLTTSVEGALFSGECVVKKGGNYYFDASKAKGDSTRVRCSIQDGDCRSFDEKTIHFFSFEGDDLVNISSSTETKNVCMEKPQAQSTFTVEGWREGLSCKLVGPSSTTTDSVVSIDNLLTITYSSLKNGDYVFTVSDECKPIATKEIKIENEEIDPDMLKLKLDTVVANTETCDGGELGDVRVEYSGNVNNADVVINLSSKGVLVKTDTLSDENAVILFDKLTPSLYEVKIFFDGMEDCTSGDDNFSREINVTIPVKFEVAFSATKAICEGSKDAMMFTETSGGNTPYTYNWTKYVDKVETKTVKHTVALHDTLPNLVKNEVYICDAVDNYGCKVSSDTLKIIYDNADSTLIDTFIYDPYQRCKGVNNSQMIVDFSVVSEYVDPVYTLSKLNEEGKYAEIDVKDSKAASNKILLDKLAPGKYKLHVGYPSVGCPSLMDTMVEIKELTNDFKFMDADSVRLPHCYANNDAAIYFHAIGASRGLSAKVFFKRNDSLLTNLKIDSLAGDTAYFVADNLPNDTFIVKMKNVCGDEISYEYMVGGSGFGAEVIEKESKLKLRCANDSDGVITAKILTGDYDSTEVKLIVVAPKVDTVISYYTVHDTIQVFVKDSTRIVLGTDEMGMPIYKINEETGEYEYDYFETETFEIKDRTATKVDYVTRYEEARFDAGGKLRDSVWQWSGLKARQYYIELTSNIKGCKDYIKVPIKVAGPNPVSFDVDVLPISCRSMTDGEISLKPRRVGSSEITYALMHDSTLYKSGILSKNGISAYEICYLGTMEKGTTGKDKWGEPIEGMVFKQEYYNGYPVMALINPIGNKNKFMYKDGEEIKTMTAAQMAEIGLDKLQIFGREWASIEWSILDPNTNKYKKLSFVTPDSTTYQEDVYYTGADTIKVPVWSYSHLSNFWLDEMGEYVEAGVQSIANLPKGHYMCLVKDTNNCEYSTEMDMLEPETALSIESVEFDSVNSKCDPTLRRVDVSVKGGWGDYNYMILGGDEEEGNGGVSDSYLAGSSMTYDEAAKKGTFRSEFLDPGEYTVAVVDGKGCRIESDEKIVVKSFFTVTATTERSICPGEERAPATFVIDDADYTGTYVVKEHISKCEDLLDCVDDSYVDRSVKFEESKKFTRDITGGGHGFFIYRVKDNGELDCGTYVRVTAADTLKPIMLSKKSINHITCNGANDGSIELYVVGGTPPYKLYANPEWGSDEILFKNEEPKMEVDEKSTYKFNYVIFDKLGSGTFAFTVVDKNKCKQYMGNPKEGTDVIVIKEPDPLTATIKASGMCSDADAARVLNFGSVSALDIKGGTSPYRYTVSGGIKQTDDDGTQYYGEKDTLKDPFIPVAGYVDTEFEYTIIDANKCKMKEKLFFDKEKVEAMRQTDFLASTWSHYGDIVALIDFCYPEKNFDSVSYVFDDPSIEILDKRMYIFDIAKGSKENQKILGSYPDTRKIPDAFFMNNFKMIDEMTPSLAKHITFIKLNNGHNKEYQKKNHDNDYWLKSGVTMSSYFKGCKYTTQVNDLMIVAYDNVDLYGGGVAKRNDILGIEISPNPRINRQTCTVSVYLSDEMDFDFNLYHMDGRSLLENSHISAASLKETVYNGAKSYVYKYSLPANDDRFNDVEIILISARTKYDSEGAYILTKQK